MAEITQIITPLDEIVPYTTNYFENISDRNNALVTTIFPQVNTWAEQANSLRTDINGKALQVSNDTEEVSDNTALAIAASVAAVEAKDMIYGYVIPTEATLSPDAINQITNTHRLELFLGFNF